jgi:hypothetical protein
MNTHQQPGSSGTGRSLRRWRAAALVAIGIAVGVAMTATPVVGHITGSVAHLWNAHIKPKTDARYYTKVQANTEFLGAEEKAADAEHLDGLDSAEFLPSGGKAADAEMLDGLDSTEFVQGRGQATGAVVTVPREADSEVFSVPGVISLRYFCPPEGQPEGSLGIFSSADMNLFVDSGGPNPTYTPLPAGNGMGLGAVGTGDWFDIQAQGAAFGVLTIDLAIRHLAGDDCHVQAQAVLTR